MRTMTMITFMQLDLVLPLYDWFNRCRDRSFRWSAKKDDGGVHTKKVYQDELESLYTGREARTYYIYAQSIAFILTTLTFSTQFPILYMLAAIYFLIHYLMNKFLLIKFYKK